MGGVSVVLRYLLLLPLLLLVGCGTPEPKKPTPQELYEVLYEDASELMTLLDGFIAKQLKAGNVCLDYENATAAMDMISAKFGAMAVLLEPMGDLTKAVQSKALQRSFRTESAKIRRQCR